MGLETGDSEGDVTLLALLLGFCLLLFKAAGMIAFRRWKLAKPPLSLDAKTVAPCSWIDGMVGGLVAGASLQHSI